MTIKIKVKPHSYHYWTPEQATYLQEVILYESQYGSNIVKWKSHASDEKKGFVFYYKIDIKRNRKDWISTIIEDIYTSIYSDSCFLEIFPTSNFLIDIS